MKKFNIILVVVVSILLTTGACFAFNNLWEFYNGNLPSVEERQEVASEAGISDYKGSCEQNVELLNYLQGGEEVFGREIPTVVALFSTSLNAKISSSSTELTLVSGTDLDGNALSGTFSMIVDEGTSVEEFIIATCADTVCTGLRRGVSVVDGWTEVSGNAYPHRRGSSIKITNFPQLGILSRVLNGDESIPNKLYYAEATSSGFASAASTSALADKAYVDDVGAGGFTASNIATGRGLHALGTSPETVGVNLASESGLFWLVNGDLGIYTSAGFNRIFIDDDGQLFVGSGSYVFTDITIERASVSDDISFTNAIPVDEGGTATRTWEKYSIPYISADDTFGAIPSGSDGDVMLMGGGSPSFESFWSMEVASSDTDVAVANAQTFEIPSTVNACIIRIDLSDVSEKGALRWSEGWIFRSGKTSMTQKWEMTTTDSQLGVTFTGATNVLTISETQGDQHGFELDFYCYR